MIFFRSFRAHFLTLVSLAYICGIAASAYCSTDTETLLLFSLVTFFSLTFCLVKRLYISGSFLCIALFFCAGIYHGIITSRPPLENRHIYNLIQDQTDTVITGYLQSMPSYDGATSKVRVRLHSVRRAVDEKQTAAAGTLLLHMRFPWPEKYKPGTFLAIRSILKRPGQCKTPGCFDFPQYLARNNIWVTGFIRSPSQITALRESGTSINRGTAVAEKIRTQVGLFLDGVFPENDLNTLYRAILIGDRSRLPEDIYENFKASGLAHILAISGLHLSIIAALLFFTIHRLLRLSGRLILHINTKKTAGFISIPILIGYGFLAGLNSPVLRACTMVVIVLLALFTNRVQTISILIAAAAMLLLVIDPQVLFTASFQLSFTAVFAISLFAPVIRSTLKPVPAVEPSAKNVKYHLQSIKSWVLAGLFTSSAAVLGTLPIILFYFHRLPLAGPLANLLVEPAICLWSLPLGFLSIPFMDAIPEFAKLLLHLGSLGLIFSNHITSFINSLPYNSIWTASPQPAVIAFYYISFLIAACALQRNITCKHLACLPFVVILLLIITPGIRLPSEQPAHEAAISFLDVGQGSAALIEFQGGVKVLIDGGGSSYSKTSVGENVLAPFLWHKGITKLDGLIVTHPDADHYNGLPFLIERFSPDFLWTGGLGSDEPGYQRLLELCTENNVAVHIAEAGDAIRKGESTISCITNTAAEAGYPKDSNGGLILRFVHKDLSILFPGDIDAITEQRLIHRGLPIKSDVLLAAHHGSATSNSIPFLEHVSPKAVIVSSAASKANYFPSSKLLAYSEQQSLPLWKTAVHGTVTIVYQKGKSEIVLVDEWQDDRNPLHRNRGKTVPVQEIFGEDETRQTAVTPR